jgi:hypothetical protein
MGGDTHLGQRRFPLPERVAPGAMPQPLHVDQGHRAVDLNKNPRTAAASFRRSRLAKAPSGHLHEVPHDPLTPTAAS